LPKPKTIIVTMTTEITHAFFITTFLLFWVVVFPYWCSKTGSFSTKNQAVFTQKSPC